MTFTPIWAHAIYSIGSTTMPARRLQAAPRYRTFPLLRKAAFLLPPSGSSCALPVKNNLRATAPATRLTAIAMRLPTVRIAGSSTSTSLAPGIPPHQENRATSRPPHPSIRHLLVFFLLNLAYSSIHIQFHSRNVRRVLRSQKRCGACHLFLLPEALHRHRLDQFIRETVQRFLWQSSAPKNRCDDRSRCYRVDPNSPANQFCGGRSCYRSQCCLRCRIRARSRDTRRTDYAGIQNDGSPIVQMRQRFLNREIRSLNIDVELFVKQPFAGFRNRRKLRHPSVHEKHIDLAEFLFYRRQKLLGFL